MFGGTPICPRCSKAVYAAEQVIGPGRKLYHKPCLACLQCNKRLDSYTLLEHDEQPYCNSCHLKHFGTPNLRHANLPSSSGGSPSGKRSTSPVRPTNTGTTVGTANGNGSSFPILRPNRSLTSPTSPTFAKSLSNPISPTYTVNVHDFGYRNYDGNGDSIIEREEYEEPSSQVNSEEMQAVTEGQTQPDADVDGQVVQAVPLATHTKLTNTGRPGIGTIPRTVPLRRHMGSKSMDSSSTVVNAISTNTTGSGSSTSSSPPSSYAQPRSPTSPLFSSFTGTRYGVALTGRVPTHSTGGIGVNNTGGVFPSATGGSPRKWGSGTPSCSRCGKSVYFAEQVKAIGKIFHKTCLRCLDCGTSLDSYKLRDHDGEPYCVRCYQKSYGPQGNGYALLGKAGG